MVALGHPNLAQPTIFKKPCTGALTIKECTHVERGIRRFHYFADRDIGGTAPFRPAAVRGPGESEAAAYNHYFFRDDSRRAAFYAESRRKHDDSPRAGAMRSQSRQPTDQRFGN